MADNVVTDPGSGGATWATDDIGGVHHLRVKVQYGDADSATDVSDTNPMPVDDAGGSLTVDNAGTFATQVDGDALTALQLIDDVVHVDDTATHASGTTKGALAMAAATPTDGSVDANDIGALAMSLDRRLLVDSQIAGQDADVTIADGGNSITVDNADITTIAGAVSGTEMQVDLVSADVTNAGTFAVQEDGAALTALQLIDDIVHVDDTATHATGTTKGALIMGAATPTDGSVGANDIGALAMSTDRRLLVDSQIVGQDADLTIADGGNSITVDNADITTIAGAVSGTEMQVDLVSADVTNAGTFAVQVDGDALTALQLIDDVVYTDDTSTHATGSSKGTLFMAAATPTDGSVGANDIGAVAMSTDRRLHTDAQIVGQDADLTIADGGNSITVDNADIATIAGAVSGTEMQVDIVSGNVTNAGTFAVQIDGDALTALQLIDDTVRSEDDASGDAHAGNVSLAVRDDALAANAGVSADGDYAFLRVNNNGALWTKPDGDTTIADGGNSITVDSADLSTIAGAVSGTEMQVDLVSANVTNVGTFATQVDGDALTALQLIDDVVYTDDTSTHATGTSKGALFMAAATPTDGSVGANDIGAVAMSTDRRLHTDAQIVGQDADLTIADGGNSITVDSADLSTIAGAVSGTEMQVDLVSADVTNAGTFAVQVDGDALTALQLIDDVVHTEDAAHNTGDKGAMTLAVRRDADTTLAGTDGDYAPLQVNAAGALKVEVFDGGDSHTVDNADITTIAGAVSGTEMQVDVVAALPAGTNAIGKLAANSGVDIGDVDVLSMPATAAEGAALPSQFVVIAGDDGTDTHPIQVNSAGNLQVANSALTDISNNMVDHDAVDAGPALKTGGKAKAFDGTAPGTDVAEDDRVDHISTVDGRQYVETAHPNYWSASVDYAAAQTNATIKAAPGAGLKLYITDVIVSNGATAGNITLLDGSGGSVLLELYPAINGGLTHAFRTPIALTANTLLAITSTTVTTHTVTVSGFIAA